MMMVTIFITCKHAQVESLFLCLSREHLADWKSMIEGNDELMMILNFLLIGLNYVLSSCGNDSTLIKWRPPEIMNLPAEVQYLVIPLIFAWFLLYACVMAWFVEMSCITSNSFLIGISLMDGFVALNLNIAASCKSLGASHWAAIDGNLQPATVVPTGRGCFISRDGGITTVFSRDIVLWISWPFRIIY